MKFVYVPKFTTCNISLVIIFYKNEVPVLFVEHFHHPPLKIHTCASLLQLSRQILRHPIAFYFNKHHRTIQQTPPPLPPACRSRSLNFPLHTFQNNDTLFKYFNKILTPAHTPASVDPTTAPAKSFKRNVLPASLKRHAWRNLHPLLSARTCIINQPHHGSLVIYSLDPLIDRVQRFFLLKIFK